MALGVAKVIIEQLGGRKFTTMTGVKHFVGSEDGVSFRLPRAYNKINCVKITLTPLDTYDMIFFRASTKKVEIISAKKDLYHDQLQSVFTSQTGLSTHL